MEMDTPRDEHHDILLITRKGYLPAQKDSSGDLVLTHLRETEIEPLGHFLRSIVLRLADWHDEFEKLLFIITTRLDSCS
jgi:hypothetical protein